MGLGVLGLVGAAAGGDYWLGPLDRLLDCVYKGSMGMDKGFVRHHRHGLARQCQMVRSPTRGTMNSNGYTGTVGFPLARC